MLSSPQLLEAYARDLIRDRRLQAERDALLAQLTQANRSAGRRPLGPRLLPVRVALAAQLRALAARLDPTLAPHHVATRC